MSLLDLFKKQAQEETPGMSHQEIIAKLPDWTKTEEIYDWYWGTFEKALHSGWIAPAFETMAEDVLEGIPYWSKENLQELAAMVRPHANPQNPYWRKWCTARLYFAANNHNSIVERERQKLLLELAPLSRAGQILEFLKWKEQQGTITDEERKKLEQLKRLVGE